MTAVFADVVGSTALGERLDAELLRIVMKRCFHEMRSAVEWYGGRVEKFIGDAVVGVFGAEAAHEDDALRAVRAADEMRSRVARLNPTLASDWLVALELRLGVATGELVVGEGAFLGDVMNTAARLEQSAPPGEIFISDATHALTRGGVEADLVELKVKGKRGIVRAWRLIAVQEPPVGAPDSRPIVGRGVELDQLRAALDLSIREGRPRLLTLVGAPGIGKSRLVLEFEGCCATLAVRPTVRRGRCALFGAGVGLQPLAQILDAQLGAVAPGVPVEERLALGVEGMVDAPWLRARLAPLLGLPGEPVERGEAFAAWQHYLEEVASRTPLVLVFEDIHWADATVLAFIDHLARHASAPITILCTARPTLLDDHPAWADHLGDDVFVQLQPLAEADMLELARRLLAEQPRTELDAEDLVGRSAGNPLFAEEFAAYGATSNPGVTPDTVQAIIAARIDRLPASDAALLRDAAALGRMFRLEALAAGVQREPDVLVDSLGVLVDQGFLHWPVDDEGRISFVHDLIHEVALHQLPRRDRAAVHLRVAIWLDSRPPAASALTTDLLAYHFAEAVRLGRETRREDTERWRGRALAAIAAAAHAALGMDAQRAAALALDGITLSVPAEDAEYGRLEGLLGAARILLGEMPSAREALLRARQAARRGSDAALLAESYDQELEVVWFAGAGAEFDEISRAALAELEDSPATLGKAMLLSNIAFIAFQRRDLDACNDLISRGLAVATDLDGENARHATPHLLSIRGLLRCDQGKRAGLEDLELARDQFLAQGSSTITMAMFHLGYGRLLWEGPSAAAQTLEEAIAHGERTRDATYETFARFINVFRLIDEGAWDQALMEAKAVLVEAEAGGLQQQYVLTAAHRARLLALRGDPSAATVMTGVLEAAFEINEAQAVSPALIADAAIQLASGHTEATRARLRQLHPAMIENTAPLTEAARMLAAIGELDHLERLVEGIWTGPTRLVATRASATAILVEAQGSPRRAHDLHADAASRWHAYGNPYEEAHALAGIARCLPASADATAAAELDARAATTFSRLGVVAPFAASLPANRAYVCAGRSQSHSSRPA
ncbi:MAG TPA: AAA family ATPase [Gaiellales bacterium]|nr:AAA family ATPase [Gaiellales bacterium]